MNNESELLEYESDQEKKKNFLSSFPFLFSFINSHLRGLSKIELGKKKGTTRVSVYAMGNLKNF